MAEIQAGYAKDYEAQASHPLFRRHRCVVDQQLFPDPRKVAGNTNQLLQAPTLEQTTPDMAAGY